VVSTLAQALTDTDAEDMESMNVQWKRLRPYIAEWFDPWYEELEETEADPYYHMNNRK
jgi:hypothetical protein